MITFNMKIPRLRTRLALAFCALTGRVRGTGENYGNWLTDLEVRTASIQGRGNATFYTFYMSGGFMCKARGTAPPFAPGAKLPTRSEVAMANGGGASFYDPAIPGHVGYARELRIVVIPDHGTPYVLNPEYS